ncbi:MAG: pyridoxal phosphate-dependent aminotransferase [Candidatus Binatia bacterium]|jgi:aspartate aminotransferase|nr:pyridoxal phosphate-dependent aminotransferase [Candidatus Binatia bacterium]
MRLSDRANAIKPSVTLAVTAKAQAMRAQGIDVVNFGAGEPDFATPVRIREAAVKAMEQGMTKYTEVRGIEPLRQAISEKYQREYGLKYSPDEVVVSCGGKHAIYNLFQATLQEGDEVIIPAPYWVSYLDMAILAGAVPRIITTKEENGFRITPEELRSALNRKTRGFMLNSPSNPTGAAYTKKDLAALSEVLEGHNCLIFSDDVYEKFVYDDFQFHTILAVNPKLRERTVILNSLSKTYAMTGWRIGYALGPGPLISAAAKIQSQSTSNASSFSQVAAVEALQGLQDDVVMMVQEFRIRRDMIVERLRAIEGVQCPNPEGAFYLFPNVRTFIGKNWKDNKIDSACKLSEFLLEEAQVAVVPGEDFGSAENVRISYALSREQIEKGCDRIAAVVKKLR